MNNYAVPIGAQTILHEIRQNIIPAPDPQAITATRVAKDGNEETNSPTLYADQIQGHQGNHQNNQEFCEAVDKVSNDLNDDNVDGILGLDTEPDETCNSAIFSWNKEYEVVPGTENESNIPESFDELCDVLVFEEVPHSSEQSEEKVKEPASLKNTEADHVHPGFQCNLCEKAIEGFRYTCVQCPDYDLCGRCESRGVHATHYVLRVPAPRPHEEIEFILDSIRKHLFKSKVFLKPKDPNGIQDMDDSATLDVKEEEDEVDPLPSVPFLPDFSGVTSQEEDIHESDEESATCASTKSVAEECHMLKSVDPTAYTEEEYLEESDEEFEMQSKMQDSNEEEYLLQVSGDEYEIELQVQDAVQDEESGILGNLCETELSLEDILTGRSSPSYRTRKRKLANPTEERIKYKVSRDLHHTERNLPGQSNG